MRKRLSSSQRSATSVCPVEKCPAPLLPFERGTGYGEISVSNSLSTRVDMTAGDKQNPFNAIKVVECGEGVSAAFGTKLLADLGAEVIKVESPKGDVTRRRGP